MKILKQKYGWIFKSQIEIEVGETGLRYTISDKEVFGKTHSDLILVPYSDVGPNITETSRVHPFSQTIIKAVLVFVVTIGSSLAIYLSQSSSRFPNIFGVLLLLSIIITYLVNRFFAQQKIISIGGMNGSRFFLFKDETGKKMLEEIVANRDTYLRKKYLGDHVSPVYPELAEWLYSLRVINEQEYQDLLKKTKEEKAQVGFVTEA